MQARAKPFPKSLGAMSHLKECRWIMITPKKKGGGAAKNVTSLAIQLIKQETRISHSSPYHPQTREQDERFHR